LDIIHEEKGMISLLSSHHKVSDEKLRQPPLERRKTKRERKEEKSKEEAKSRTGPCPQGCEDQICIFVSFKLWFHHLW
jgi:hypothetical protein